MGRRARIALELLAPPMVASVLFTIVMSVVALSPGGLAVLPIVLLYAYPFAGIPSALFTAVMEVAFWRGLDPGGWRAVRLAALLGLLSGLLIAVPFSLTPEKACESLTLFSALGATTGALVGNLVRSRSRGQGATLSGTRHPGDAPLPRSGGGEAG